MAFSSSSKVSRPSTRGSKPWNAAVSDQIGEEEWRQHVAKIPKAEQDIFIRNSKNSLEAYKQAIENSCKDLKDRSVLYKIFAFFDPLYKLANNFVPAISLATSPSLDPSALVLGGIMCVFQVAVNFTDYHERVARELTKMARKADILAQYGADVYQTSEPVRLAVIEIYGDILEFCQQVYKLYVKKSSFISDKVKIPQSIKIVGASMLQTFEKRFSSILEKFYKDLEDFNEKATLYERQVSKEHRKIVLEKFHEQLERLKESQKVQSELLAETKSHHAWEEEMQAQTFQRKDAELLRRQEKERVKQEEMRKEKRAKVITWLPHISFTKIHNRLRLLCLEGTGQWILKDEKYIPWATSERSALLWVKGKPGSGKSVLASSVILELKRSHLDGNGLAYVYCNALSRSEDASMTVLCCILEQLTEQLAELEPGLEKMYDQTHGGRKLDLDITTAKSLTMAALAKLDVTYIIIDGLDECLDHGDIALILAEIVKTSSTTVRVMVLSRPEYQDIQDSFADFPQLSVDFTKNKDDIQKYIFQQVSAKNIKVRKDSDLLDEIREKMLSTAGGMFLWVFLFTKELEKQSRPNRIKETFEAFPIPGDLNQLYERAMSRITEEPNIDNRKMALKALFWAANSAQPLSEAEMLEAIVMRPEIPFLDEGDRLGLSVNVAEWCADLIDKDSDGYYHLIHVSLRDFLLKLPASSDQHYEYYCRMQINANSIMAQICLTYLQMDNFKTYSTSNLNERQKLKEENPLLLYAAKNWRRHMIDDLEDSLAGLIQNLINSSDMRDMVMQLHGWDDSDEPECTNVSKLHFVAFFDLARTYSDLPKRDSLLRIKDNCGRLPLDYAMLGKKKEMCLRLLDPLTNLDVKAASFETKKSLLHRASILDWPEVVYRLVLLKHKIDSTAWADNSTPLAEAAHSGSDKCLKILLAEGANPNHTLTNNDTPLLLAAEANQEVTAKLLLEAGAHVNRHARGGHTALHYAASRGNVSLVKALLDAGGDPTQGVTGYGPWTAMHEAASEGYPEVIAALANIRPLLDIPTSDCRTPLLVAAHEGSLTCCQLLVRLGANIKQRRSGGFTILHISAYAGHREITEYLLKLGISVDEVDEDGDTALRLAALRGWTAIAGILLRSGASLDKPNSNGSTPLIGAIVNGHAELANVLLGHGCDPLYRNKSGHETMHFVAYSGITSLIDPLRRRGVDVIPISSDGFTPLHWAAMSGSLNFIQYYLTCLPGDLLASRVNRILTTPLHLAAENGHLDVVQFLCKYGFAQKQDADRNLPIHKAAWAGNELVVAELLSHENISARGCFGRTVLHIASVRGYRNMIDLILTHGADVNCTDDLGATPLFEALRYGYPEIADILHRHGAELGSSRTDGHTILHAAAQSSNMGFVKLLLDNGYSGLVSSDDGLTPFFIAVEANNAEVVAEFIDRGYNGTNIPSEVGITCLHVASRCGNVEMMKKLLEWGANRDACDFEGKNAIWYAARNGHVEAVDLLVDEGVSLHSETGLGSTPLYAAATEGYYIVVQKLLAAGARIDQPSPVDNLTAVAKAAQKNRPLTLELLLEAGADIHHSDAFGLSAADYAARHISLSLALSKTDTSSYGAGKPKREMYLNDSIRKALTMLLTRSAERSIAQLPNYIRHLNLLTNALGYARNHPCAKFTLECFMDRIFATDLEYYEECNMCKRVISQESCYACLQCDFLYCQACYDMLVEAKNRGKNVPEALETIQKLENSVVSVLQKFLGNEHLPFSMLMRVVNLSDTVNSWFEDTAEEYRKWQETYNNKNHWENDARLGHDIIILVDEARRAIRKKGNALLEFDVDQSWDTKWEELLNELALEKELPIFDCYGHDYLEISFAHYQNLKTSGTTLDGNGHLSTALLERMLAMCPPTELSDNITEDQTQSMGREPDPIENSQNNGPGCAEHDASALLVRHTTLQPAASTVLAVDPESPPSLLARAVAAVANLNDDSWIFPLWKVAEMADCISPGSSDQLFSTFTGSKADRQDEGFVSRVARASTTDSMELQRVSSFEASNSKDRAVFQFRRANTL